MKKLNTVVLVTIVALCAFAAGYLARETPVVAAPVETDDSLAKSIAGLQVQIAGMQEQMDTLAACACNAPVVDCGVVATITETVSVPTYIVVTETVTITEVVTTPVATVVVTTPVVTSTPDAPSSSTPEPVVTSTPEPKVTATPEPKAEKTPAPKKEKKQGEGNPGNTKDVGKAGEKEDRDPKFNSPDMGGPGDKGASDGDKKVKPPKKVKKDK